MGFWILWIALTAYAIYYCKGVAKKLKMNEPLAIIFGLFAPILALLIYAHLGFKASKQINSNKQV